MPKPDCIFCKIIAGEIPSDMVYEDEFAAAFMDINPANPGHVLVCPLEHSDSFSVMPDGENTEKLFGAVRRVAAAACQAVGHPDFNVIVNNGPLAGQVVMHTHVHVIPRYAGDGNKPWPKKDVPKEEIARIAAEMRRIL